MKTSFVRGLLQFAFFLGSLGLLQAHPGHDDGHELTWDFGHLAAHPGATALCFVVLAVAVWGVIRLIRRPAAVVRPN